MATYDGTVTTSDVSTSTAIRLDVDDGECLQLFDHNNEPLLREVDPGIICPREVRSLLGTGFFALGALARDHGPLTSGQALILAPHESYASSPTAGRYPVQYDDNREIRMVVFAVEPAQLPVTLHYPYGDGAVSTCVVDLDPVPWQCSEGDLSPTSSAGN